MIEANPDLKGLYGANEGSAIGALKGAGSRHEDITVIGFDSGKAQTDAIRSGEMAGAITQNPFGMGEELVQAAFEPSTARSFRRSTPATTGTTRPTSTTRRSPPSCTTDLTEGGRDSRPRGSRGAPPHLLGAAAPPRLPGPTHVPPQEMP